MSIIPYRVRKFASDRFPLAYHLVANAGWSGNDVEHWNARLRDTWDVRDWPGKVDLIESLTRGDQAIVDVGCGSGSILRRLKSDGYGDLHGVELSDYAVARLRDEGITMWQGKLPMLPLADTSFDVLIASQVLEHIIRRQRFMTEVKRVLRPGGSALIFVPDDCLGPIDEPEHVIRYDRESLRAFLAKTFDVITVDSMRDPNFTMSILFAHVRKGTS